MLNIIFETYLQFVMHHFPDAPLHLVAFVFIQVYYYFVLSQYFVYYIHEMF